MVYTKTLPQTDSIALLAKLVRPFPTNRRAIEETAKKCGYTETTLDFLKLFPANEQFASRAEFLNRCDDLELFINGERTSPVEHLRSPQD